MPEEGRSLSLLPDTRAEIRGAVLAPAYLCLYFLRATFHDQKMQVLMLTHGIRKLGVLMSFTEFQFKEVSGRENFPGGSGGKSICLQCWRPRFDPWVGKIPWRRKLQPTPVLLPRKFHGWRSLVGYSPWGRKESDRTERLHTRQRK